MSVWNNMEWVPGLRTPALDVFFELVTLTGYPLFLILFLCFGYYAFGARRFFHTTMLLMAAGLLNSWLKDFGQDPRPDAVYALDGRVGTSYGWPSGHTQIAVVLWGYLAWSMQRQWAYWAAAAYIGLQAFSRLYLGVHDLGDVAGGLVIGVLCLAAYVGAERNAVISNRLSAMPAAQLVGGLVALHVLFAALYPAHAGHEAPYWFMGAMTGWLAARLWRGHEAIVLPGPVPAQAALAAVLTAICFGLLLLTSRLPEALFGEHMAAEYGFGVVFGLAVAGALPYVLGRLPFAAAGPSR